MINGISISVTCQKSSPLEMKYPATSGFTKTGPCLGCFSGNFEIFLWKRFMWNTNQKLLLQLNLCNSKQLLATALLLDPLKTLENLYFSDVVAKYKKRPVAWDGLTMNRFIVLVSMCRHGTCFFCSRIAFAISPFHATDLLWYPLETSETRGFLMVSGGITRDQWHEMG